MNCLWCRLKSPSSDHASAVLEYRGKPVSAVYLLFAAVGISYQDFGLYESRDGCKLRQRMLEGPVSDK